MKGEKVRRHWLIGSAIVLLAGVGLFLLLIWRRLPPEIPWLYSLPWGEQQLIPKIWFVMTLPIALAVVLVNLAISRFLERYDRVAAILIEGAVLLLTLMFLAGWFRVVSIIT